MVAALDSQAEGIRQNIRNEMDIVLARVVLGALEELRSVLGHPPNRRDLVGFLTRRKGARPRAPTLDGLLQSLRWDGVRAIIRILEERRLLVRAEGNKLALTLTGEGSRFLRGVLPAPTGIVELVVDRAEERSDLFAALRSVRASIAALENIPAYQVLHDRALREIVARRPRSVAELALVPSIGPRRAARFGPDFLDCVIQHARACPPALVEPVTTSASDG